MTGLLVNSTGLAFCSWPQRRAAVHCPGRSNIAYSAQSSCRTCYLLEHGNVPSRRAQVALATSQNGPSGSSAAGEDVTKRYNVGYCRHLTGTQNVLSDNNLALGLQVLLALIARFMTLPDKQQLLGFLRSQPDTTSTMFLLWVADKEAQAVGEQKRVGRQAGWG